MSKLKGAWTRLRPASFPRTIATTVQILAAIHLFSTSVAELRPCTGFSMLPTLAHDGTLVLVSPLYYWTIFKRFNRPPQRGDLIFATNPLDPHYTVCKRVIGLEGDLIEVEPRRGGTRKWIDDQPHGEGEEIVRSIDPLVARRKGEETWIKVPKGHVWLAGDNMSNSTDSRTYGPVPYRMIKGKVMAQVWPRFKWFENPVRHLDGPSLA